MLRPLQRLVLPPLLPQLQGRALDRYVFGWSLGGFLQASHCVHSLLSLDTSGLDSGICFELHVTLPGIAKKQHLSPQSPFDDWGFGFESFAIEPKLTLDFLLI
jgi:hypothetical protein